MAEVGGSHSKSKTATLATLRDLLHVEIENKTKACANPSYQCPERRLEGFKFCLQHILQDSQAPYTNCAYTFPISGQRCPLAAPLQKNKHFSNYCFEHSRLFQLTKTRAQPGKMQRPDTVEGHLGQLIHYVRLDKTQKEDEEVDVLGMSNDPLVDINSAKVNERSRKILDYASDSSDMDDEKPVAANVWPTDDMDNSDCESVDTDLEDPLKHAGIYTTEEACRLAREKLIRLRALYLNQFHRLGYLLREKRRKYLVALRKERETYCSIANQPKDTPEERHKYEQLRALNKYHKHNGAEAVLRRKYIERRVKTHGGNAANKPSFYNKCTFAEGSVKCPERSIPCSKFCRRHIMQDRKQVLFRACGVEKGGIVCQDAVPMIFDDSTCPLHIEMPPERTYLMKKYESDPDDDEDDEQALDSEDSAMVVKPEYNATVKTEVDL